jgi:IS30 family transposase
MSHGNCNSESLRGKHLTIRERYVIETLAKEKMAATAIATRLGRDRRTIERELQMGKTKLKNSDWSDREEYCAEVAQQGRNERSTHKGPSLKIGYDHALAKHIEEKIKRDKYSPDAIIGEIKTKQLKFKNMICTKTLYNYIARGLFANLSNQDLLFRGKRKKTTNRRNRISFKNLKGTSIDERPQSIEDRQESGHWEIDCVVGKQGGSRATLLVLSERKTRREIIRKMPDRTQSSVIAAIDELERKYGDKFYQEFKTITADNGSEFLDYRSMERSLRNPECSRVKVYYAHPYSAWERGTNENSNQIIRRFIPKGTDIGKISKTAIDRIERWMNNYPRKILGYKTANEMAA